ncbi:MAG TPA: proline dehydrogenase family protein [Candidatus Polarisedimenticolia bacterium]|nr:proline dehydrogenase family protein [Candidatus Polarisedimenticolia bacterium]
MSALDFVVSRTLPLIPRPLVHRVSRRYIAGDALDDAVGVVRSLNGRGLLATLDVLGESVTSPGPVEGAVREYLAALERIRGERLQCNISVKPTQLGLKIDAALCGASLRRLAQAAHRQENFVRIDMEDSSCTTATLDQHATLRAEGFSNVGVVLQAYLRRSLRDVRALPAGANVRLCKGIYVEPRAIAYRDRAIVNRNFVRLLEELLERGAYVGIATHDEELVWEAERILDRRGLRPEEYEFQMLLGVDEELRDLVHRGGHRLRIYVPYGANWYAYSLRRLKENPRLAGYVMKSLWGRRRA